MQDIGYADCTVTNDITAVSLTTVEESRLVELESIVTSGLQTFLEVGSALCEIQSSRLYRATHSTFEAYVRDRFDISRPRAYELITSASTVSALSAMADTPLPANERQARELAGLSPEVAALVMTRAYATSVGGAVTAEMVRTARYRIEGVASPLPRVQRRKPLRDAATDAGWKLRKAVEALQRVLADDRYKSNKDLVDNALAAHIQFALEVLTAHDDSLCRSRGSFDAQ